MTTITALGLGLAVAASCSSDSSGPGDGVDIEMRDSFFTPTPRTVSVGTTVRWRNAGAIQHNTVSNTGEWSSGNLNPGGTHTHTFNQAGTFAYRCTLHPEVMTGTIVVQ